MSQIRDDFFRRLRDDYAARKNSSVIYEYCRWENDRYLEEMIQDPGKAKTPVRKMVYLRHRYGQGEIDDYTFLKELFGILGKNRNLYNDIARDSVSADTGSGDGPSGEEWNRLLCLVRPYLELFLGEDGSVIMRCKKTKLPEYFVRMSEAMDHQDMSGKLADEGIDRNEIEELYAFLMNRCIHASVQQYFYDSGRPDRVDKTMTLLEMFCENKGIESLGAGTVRNASVDEAKDFFCVIVEKGRKQSGKWADEGYLDVFIPLFVDERTGMSLCIVGRNHYSSYLEDSDKDRSRLRKEYEKSTYPCALCIMNFTDSSQNTEIPAITDFECGEEKDFTYRQRDKAGRELDGSDYFDVMYAEYRTCVEDTKGYQRETLNRLSIIPDEIAGLYRDYFSVE